MKIEARVQSEHRSFSFNQETQLAQIKLKNDLTVVLPTCGECDLGKWDDSTKDYMHHDFLFLKALILKL